MVISIIGGTGKEGRGLAYRLAKAKHQIIIGSRDYEKAKKAVSVLNAPSNNIRPIMGKQNIEAAKEGEIIVLTVPYTAHRSTLATIKELVQGKIVIDVTVPLIPPHITQVHIPEAGSAAVEAQQILGDKVKVVSAFQNIAYENLFRNED